MIILQLMEIFYLGVCISKPELGQEPVLTLVVGRPNLYLKLFNSWIDYLLDFYNVPGIPAQDVAQAGPLSLVDRHVLAEQ